MAEITHIRKDHIVPKPDVPETARERANRLMHEAETAAGDVIAEALAAAEATMQLCAETGRMRGGHQGVRDEMGRMATDMERRIATIRSMRTRA